MPFGKTMTYEENWIMDILLVALAAALWIAFIIMLFCGDDEET